MGGSGGGGGFSHGSSSQDLSAELEETDRELAAAQFDQQLSSLISEKLADINSRKPELAKARLEDVLKKLESRTEDTFETLYGGSVAKKTHVEGLSDIDALLLIDETKHEDKAPGKVLEHLEERLKKTLGADIEVKKGTLAVTLKYSDGMEIQLLPALRGGGELQIPSVTGKSWASIDPKKFTDALTRWNQKCSRQLIPMIKLVKSINASFPENVRLSGYHVEALAISCFRGYQGKYELPHMIKRFFERGKDLVQRPIVDSTGQSVRVDDYLGAASSKERQLVSHLFDAYEKRIDKALRDQDYKDWSGILDGTK
jgi:predicted nucleotidyltransferase